MGHRFVILVLGLKNSPGGLVPIILVKGDLKY